MLRTGTALIFAVLAHAVTACEWGKHGEKCDKRCPPNCQVNQQRNLTHCNKETGECSDGCITGWYAAQCDQLCSKNCLDNVCYHQNGRCSNGCSGNTTGDFCEITKVLTRTVVKLTTDETTGLSTANVAVIITLSLVAITVIIVVAVVIIRRRQTDNRRRSTGRPKAGADPENPEGEPLLQRRHALPSSRIQTIDEYAGVMERDVLAREIQQIEQVFVVTAIYNKVKEGLERFRHVTISGAAGDGKTSMALMLGSEYQKKGYELYFVDDISEFKLSVLSQGKDQCFIFDDIFGTVGISTDSPHLRRILGYLNSCLEDMTSTDSETFQTGAMCISQLNHIEKNMADTFIIFTTKSYNLKQGITHLKNKDEYMFFKGASVIDLTQTQYTVDDKRQMCLKHKNYNNITYECDVDEICGIKGNMFGFPLTCKLFFIFLRSHKRYEQTFWEPLTYLRKELEVLLSKMNNESAALILMLLCDGKLNMRHLEIKSSNKELEDHLSIVSSFVNNFNRAKVITCVRDFFGTYFTKGDITRFSHPSIYDACACVLYETNHAFVLKHCSIRFLYERVQAETVPACETDEDRHVIYVSDVYNDIIASRLAGAVREGNYRMSVMHPILERHDIVDNIIAELKPFLTDTSVTDEHGNNIFHYACYSGNVYLVRQLIPFCDINSRGAEGVTPIRIAVLLGREDLFYLLVSKGADLTLTDNTLLYLACAGGNRSIVEYLLPSFDINSRRQHGWTVLMVAAVCGKKDTFDLLVSKGADLTLTDGDNDTVLHLACQGGNRSIVEYLLPSFDINSPGQHDQTAVMRAAFSAKKDVFEMLVSKGADLTLTDDYNDTVLHLACQGGNRSIVEHLLPLFDINSRGRHGWTGLMQAAVCAKKDTFDLLVSKGADLTLTDDYKDTVLHLACQGGNRSIVEYLLPLFDINSRGRYGWIGLMKAAVYAKKDTFDLLVSKGADLTLTDDYNDTVLHLACQGGNRSIVEHLLPLFDINSRGRHGWTGLMQAAVCAKKDTFDLFVSKGADLTLTDDYNDTVLHLACQGGNILIVEQLLPMCDINCRGYKGWTPVMKGAYCGMKDIFDLLLSKGANPSLTGDDNDTLLHAASRCGNIDIVTHVIGDFDINTRGGNGQTPLMHAVCGDHTDVVDFLVDHGADVNMLDNDGDSLLHLACESGNLKMVNHVMSYSDINPRDNFGWTPLAMAAVEGNYAVFKYLKGRGADPTLTDRAGDDVYTLALQGGCRGIIKELGREEHSDKIITPWNKLMKSLVKSQMVYLKTYSQQSPALVQTDQYGDSLLHLACRGGSRQCVEYLLPTYDINIRGRYDWTPVMMAAVCGHGDIFQLLVSDKADLSLVSNTGEDITTLAHRGNNDDIFRYLLEKS